MNQRKYNIDYSDWNPSLGIVLKTSHVAESVKQLVYKFSYQTIALDVQCRQKSYNIEYYSICLGKSWGCDRKFVLDNMGHNIWAQYFNSW
jgi:hypothetical protein